ncbi:MAG TPA: efflux RND transporter periplasmic adaptor subunit [Candidatus Baltobacteraceae bacterium]|jgi:multidrug efflux pump subunit AcrA (membrane-fusion protein)
MGERSARLVARLLCAATTILFISACSKPKPVAAPPFVETTVASFGAISPSESLAGIVAPYENVAVQSSLSEPADSVAVQEGDVVHKGQVLAQLDTADLQAQLDSDMATAQSNGANTSHAVYQGSLSIAQGQDQLHQAEATLLNDNTNLQRDLNLLKQGYISQQSVDAQQAVVRNDEAGVASARSTVAANGSLSGQGLQSSSIQQSKAQEQVAIAQADQVRVQIAKATITSPIDGVIVNRNLNPGEYPGNRQLFTIQQMNPVYGVLRASSSQVTGIAVGAPAVVSVAGAQDVRVPGKVAGVLNQIVPGSTDFIVKVLLPNTNSRLRSGMAVSGIVAKPSLHGVRIPVTAFIDDNHDSLLTVDGQGIVKTATVREVGNDGTTSVITGVTPGTRVVSNGQSSVGDGERVSYQP